MAVSSLCMLFHEPGVMLAADMQAMQDEAVKCQGLTGKEAIRVEAIEKHACLNLQQGLPNAT